jgi:succinate dehydrogenase hydrophobic anchor subunit
MPTSTPLDTLNQWAPIVWLKTNSYAYPTLETVHLIAMAMVFGTVVIVDLRLLGVIRAIDTRLLAKTLLPWTLAGFALALLTGLTMFTSRVGDFISNPAFIVKMCLLLAAGTNAAVLHARGVLDDGSAITKTQAVLSIAIWIAIIFCGRWIAYV